MKRGVRVISTLEAEGLNVRPLFDGNVLRRESVEVLEEGHRILEAARRRAGQIEADAARAGRAAGLAEWLDRLEALDEEVGALRARTRDEALALAFDVAERIVRREVERDPSFVVGVLDARLDDLPAGRVVVRVARSDLSGVRQLLRSRSERRLSVEEDPELTPGDCVIVTERGMIDATIETQIAVLREALGETR